jgi:hypothetical protein
MTYTEKYLRAGSAAYLNAYSWVLRPGRPDLAAYLADVLPDGTTEVAA